jgi:hypothetical protein
MERETGIVVFFAADRGLGFCAPDGGPLFGITGREMTISGFVFAALGAIGAALAWLLTVRRSPIPAFF